MGKRLLILIIVLAILVVSGLVWSSHNNVGDVPQAKVFLANAALAGEGNECAEVYPVHRDVAATDTPEAMVRAAIEALLAGPTADESARGYTTSIPSGVELNNVQINEYAGVMTIDMSSEIETGGSCRVESIAQQIKATASEVLEDWYPDGFLIAITVDGGSPDEALQP